VKGAGCLIDCHDTVRTMRFLTIFWWRFFDWCFFGRRLFNPRVELRLHPVSGLGASFSSVIFIVDTTLLDVGTTDN
jgi:hypothetical protein